MYQPCKEQNIMNIKRRLNYLFVEALVIQPQ